MGRAARAVSRPRTGMAWGLAVLLSAPASAPTAVRGLADLVASPARAAETAGPVVLDHLSFRRGRLTVEIPHLEARGTSLTAPELRDILDPASSLAVGQRLARLTAAAVAAREVTFRLDPKPGEAAGQSVTAHDVLLTDLRAGKAAALSIASVDGVVRSGPAERDAVSTGAVTAHALDPQLALAIATGSRTDRELPVSPVYADISVADLTLKTDGAQFARIDRVESGAFEGRPLLDSPAGLLRSLEGSPGAMPPAEKSRFYGALFDAAASFKLDRFLVSGASFTGDGNPKNAFRLGKLLVSGLESFRLGLLQIDDAALDTGDIHLSMRSASLANVDRTTLLGTAFAQLSGLSPPVNLPPSSDAAGGTEFKLSDLHLAFPTTDADAPFPVGTVQVVDVPTIESGESASRGGALVEAHTHAEVRYDVPPGGADAAIQKLRDMGLSHLDVGFGYRVSYDIPKRELRLDELGLDGKDIGSVALSARLADLPDAPLRQGLTADEVTAKFATSTFRDIALTVVDRGIVERALPVIARDAGTSPALLRAGLKTKVDIALPGLLGQTSAEAAVARAIDAFIDGGGTLVLSARSAGGLALKDAADIGDPAALARRLDITAENHR